MKQWAEGKQSSGEQENRAEADGQMDRKLCTSGGAEGHSNGVGATQGQEGSLDPKEQKRGREPKGSEAEKRRNEGWFQESLAV